MLNNYKAVVCYDGTDYHGWQRQPHKRTIQGILEGCLAKISQKKIDVIGAGRTDAGVHAQGQVANFKTSLGLNQDEFFRAINSLLPKDIRIVSLDKVDMNFHARKTAKSKKYQYRIFNSRNINPFVQRYVLQWISPLDVHSMKKAARLFEREADFSPFSSNKGLQPVRKVILSEIMKKGSEIVYTVEANGFLRYMVRTMVGTLLEIGRGKLEPAKIEEIFTERKRSLASTTAPAKGLCLMSVNY